VEYRLSHAYRKPFGLCVRYKKKLQRKNVPSLCDSEPVQIAKHVAGYEHRLLHLNYSRLSGLALNEKRSISATSNCNYRTCTGPDHWANIFNFINEVHEKSSLASAALEWTSCCFISNVLTVLESWLWSLFVSPSGFYTRAMHYKYEVCGCRVWENC